MLISWFRTNSNKDNVRTIDILGCCLMARVGKLFIKCLFKIKKIQFESTYWEIDLI